MEMKIHNITDAEFKKYGCVLEGYDFSELREKLLKVKIPGDGIEYVASEPELEMCKVCDEILKRGFGSYPIQIGYVNGKNRTLNCLEYHKSSEFNITLDDIILVLGCVCEIENGSFDTSLCKAFLVPAGVGVELYGTTLHYAPMNVNDDGYRVMCVLPRGTNAPKLDFAVKNNEDKMCFGVNKWLMAHKDAPEIKNGAYSGLSGKNLTYEK